MSIGKITQIFNQQEKSETLTEPNIKPNEKDPKIDTENYEYKFVVIGAMGATIELVKKTLL